MSVESNDDASLIALEVLMKIRHSPSTVVQADGIDNGRAIVSPLKGSKNSPACLARPEPVGEAAALVNPHFVPKSIQPREKTHRQVKSSSGHPQSTENAVLMNETRRMFATDTSCEPMMASFSVVPVKPNPVFVSMENLQPKALKKVSTPLLYERPQIAPHPEKIQRYDSFSTPPEGPASAAVAMMQAPYPKRSTAPILANNAFHIKNGLSQPISKKVSTDALNKIDEAVNLQIRKEEVNAALRSVPQRGRKRENLSALERVELTRTRNREHAKSTRVRKKARYQELLDTEQKFKEIEKRDELNSKRLASLQTYSSIRSNIISNALHRKLSDSNNDASNDPSRSFVKESNATPPESDVSTSKSTSDSKANRQSRTVSFVDFANIDSPFSRHSEIQSSDVNELHDLLHWSKGDRRAQNELAVISTQDRNILDHVLATYNITSESSLCYRLTDSADGIARTSGDVAYAEYEVALKQGGSTGNDTVIFSGILKVRFGDKSRNILALQYSSMSAAFKSSASDASLSGDLSYSATAQEVVASTRSSLGSLGYQKSFPSVVSLENSHVDSENKDAA